MLLEDTPIGCSLTLIIVLGGVGFVNRFWRNLLHFGARFSEYRLKKLEAFTMAPLNGRYGILQSWITGWFYSVFFTVVSGLFSENRSDRLGDLLSVDVAYIGALLGGASDNVLPHSFELRVGQRTALAVGYI